ncbi:MULTISPECIES: GntR family transcriptional regulator [unclassified Streptomyces]|uniref:GntR family transcriptional regulator n=1 Tax=unclassified Streptomyces TaxID=2593676 RepID=UPI0037FFE66E
MTEKAWATQLPPVKSKADLVYDSLREAILSGRLAPGERVNMDELARSLGVSKIPIREAVKRLESEGLLASRAHSGVVVTRVDKSAGQGAFLAREVIDGLVAKLAAARADDRLLSELRAVQQGMREALRTKDADELQHLNSEFHRLLAEASGYHILAELTEWLLVTIRRYRVAAPRAVPDWAAVIEEHEVILDALRRKDPVSAEAAARAHTVSQAGREVEGRD